MLILTLALLQDYVDEEKGVTAPIPPGWSVTRGKDATRCLVMHAPAGQAGATFVLAIQPPMKAVSDGQVTLDDFLSLPEGTLAELIDGEILITPAPRERHQSVLGNLYHELRNFLQQRPLGRVFISPFDVHLPSGDVVEPDLIFGAQANLGIIRDWVRGVPDLLVEVVSPSHPERDRLVKRALYARNGVREFWIVDPEEKTVEVLVLEGDRFRPAGFFREAETLVSPLLSGFTLPLGPVFAS